MAKTAPDPNLTQAGGAFGVADHVPPEQVKGVSRLDARADVYSLGAVLYQALTGPPCHAGSREHGSRGSQFHQSGSSRELDRIILKALAKEP